ncbi:MAG: hypothetical protein DI570_14750 [Phenylobacterium zucineum]|nr:MAG: hypothetical protein DI570_14750 [Phenylobacterium zucineum]
MYIGHFAIGMAIKAAAPKVRALPILVGAGFLDIIDGVLIVAGIDRVTPNLQAGPYLFFDLTFIDWDHSLLMALVLSLAWAALFLKQRTAALVAGLACFSHFLADLPMHNADLAVYPYAAKHLGLGLWGRLQTGAWVLEGLFAAIVLAWAWTRFRARGVAVGWPLLVLGVLFVNLSPWLSPMKVAAGLPEPQAHLLHGVLVTLGFLGPGALLAWLVDRAERRSVAAT